MNSATVSSQWSRLVKILLIAAAAFTIGYLVKLSVETAFRLSETTKDVIENVNSKTETSVETKVHGNSDKNMKLHKVYHIFAEDSWGVQITLKYGITAQDDFKTKDGNPRPEYQVTFFQSLPEYKNLKFLT